MNATPTSLNSRRQRGDEGLYVQFSVEALESELQSKEQGRPVYYDAEFVEIRIPGDDKTIIRNIVSDEYRSRFPDEYAAFKSGMKIATTGTPLEHWGLLSKSQVAELKHSNVTTVEELAGLSDSNAQKFMGGSDLRDKATAFLKSASDTALVQKQETALKEMQAKIDALTAERKK